MTLVAGTTFGAYRVMEQLGKGGMASVFKAYEAGLDRYVALKVLPADFLHEEAFADRFQREARVVAKLEHPNIVPIFNYGIESRVPWMAMRLIPGGTLSSRLQRGALPHKEIARILRAVADALEYAHGKGILHRDVKPQNVLLDESGRVYLADFGIAKMAEGSATLTQAGMISGTPQYMAPEQATGTKMDHRCDIYALGVMAYEMLTGSVPFTADTPVAVLIKHMSDPIPLPSLGSVPEPLFRPVLKCLAKNPEDRWRTVTEFADALERGLADAGPAPTISLPREAPFAASPGPPSGSAPTVPPPPATRPSPAPMPPRPPVRVAQQERSRVVVVVAILAVLGLTGVGIVMAFFLLGIREPIRSHPESPAPTLAASTTPPTPSPVPIEAATSPSATPEAQPVKASPRRDVETSVPARARSAQPTVPSSAEPSPPPPASPHPLPATLPPAPTVPSSPSIELDLEVVRDPEGPWTASVLYAAVRVGDRASKDVVVAFEGGNRRRQTVLISEVPTGSQRLLVVLSNSRAMDSDATIRGTKEVLLGTGVNRIGIEVRFLGPDDWTIRFR